MAEHDAHTSKRTVLAGRHRVLYEIPLLNFPRLTNRTLRRGRTTIAFANLGPSFPLLILGDRPIFLSLTVLGMMRVKLRSYTAPRNCFRSAINSGEEFGSEYSSLSCYCPRLRSDVRRPPCSRALTQLPAPLFLNDSQFGRCFPLVPPARVFIGFNFVWHPLPVYLPSSSCMAVDLSIRAVACATIKKVLGCRIPPLNEMNLIILI
ncbi:hypothetical protein BGY98DRAFT_543348 [Russula aff. rugulosa BPL654]|nr:hypothetical protein BGY98DRAFT_543348 [Russula aff. rugulosa BPL654]